MNNGRQSKRHSTGPPSVFTPMMLVNEVSKLFMDIVRSESEHDQVNMQNSYRHLLFHLAIQDGRTQLELSKLTHLKAPTVSVTLQKMERDGYVIRRQNENDLRQTLVYLTEKGFEYNDKIRRRMNELDKIVMQNITPEEAGVLFGILKHMRDNIFEEGKKLHIHEID